MNNRSSVNEEQDYWNASERHAQIMASGVKFFRRLAFVVLGVITIVCGFFVFLLVKHPFWRYP